MATPRTGAYIEYLRVNTLQKVGATTGSTIVFTGDEAVLLPAGGAGQVLTSNGPGNALTWGPGGGSATYTVNTTDATPTTLATFPTAVNTSLRISAEVVGRRTGGAAGLPNDTFSVLIDCLAKNNGGVLTTHVTTAVQIKDQLAWNIAYVVAGANANLTVTGALNNNITWNATATSFST